ncbi:hypothetical protein [Nostoc sp.]|uniref:hypothetical protein n=1 Tax=Nostoc sp. TaxID=1180 RepID=UPI002FFC47F2
MVEMLVELFGQLSTEEMRAITEYELTRRIDKILVLEAVSGTLNDSDLLRVQDINLEKWLRFYS